MKATSILMISFAVVFLVVYYGWQAGNSLSAQVTQ